MIKVVYDSLLGSGKRFASKLGYKMEAIKDYVADNDQVILLTRSFNYGEIPVKTVAFMQEYHQLVIGIAVNGNRNWGDNYGAAGIKLKNQYGTKNLLIYEGTGYQEEVDIVKSWT